MYTYTYVHSTHHLLPEPRRVRAAQRGDVGAVSVAASESGVDGTRFGPGSAGAECLGVNLGLG